MKILCDFVFVRLCDFKVNFASMVAAFQLGFVGASCNRLLFGAIWFIVLNFC